MIFREKQRNRIQCSVKLCSPCWTRLLIPFSKALSALRSSPPTYKPHTKLFKDQ